MLDEEKGEAGLRTSPEQTGDSQSPASKTTFGSSVPFGPCGIMYPSQSAVNTDGEQSSL